jgi:hypothetical protein
MGIRNKISFSEFLLSKKMFAVIFLWWSSVVELLSTEGKLLTLYEGSMSGSHVGEKYCSPPQIGNHSCPRQNLQIVSSVCCFRRDSSVQLILWHFCFSSTFTGQLEPREPATSKEREFTTCRNWQGYTSGSDLGTKFWISIGFCWNGKLCRAEYRSMKGEMRAAVWTLQI